MDNDDKIKVEDVLRAVKADPMLSEEDKNTIEAKLTNDPSFFKKLVYGGLGAGSANVISNWIKLSKRAKIILTVAGFGIGLAILDKVSKNEENKPVKYNKQTRLYEVK